MHILLHITIFTKCISLERHRKCHRFNQIECGKKLSSSKHTHQATALTTVEEEKAIGEKKHVFLSFIADITVKEKHEPYRLFHHAHWTKWAQWSPTLIENAVVLKYFLNCCDCCCILLRLYKTKNAIFVHYLNAVCCAVVRLCEYKCVVGIKCIG